MSNMKSTHYYKAEDTDIIKLSPQSGDFWEEHCTPVAFIIAVSGDFVLLAGQWYDHFFTSGSGTMFNEEFPPVWMPILDFARHVSYQGIPGTWASCSRVPVEDRCTSLRNYYNKYADKKNWPSRPDKMHGYWYVKAKSSTAQAAPNDGTAYYTTPDYIEALKAGKVYYGEFIEGDLPVPETPKSGYSMKGTRPKLTADEFDAIAKLKGLNQKSPVNQAARAILVDATLRQCDAKQAYGVGSSSMCDALKRYCDAYYLIRTAFNIERG